MKHHILALSIALLLSVPLHQAHAQLQPQPGVDPFTGAFQCAIPVMTVPGPHGSSYTITLNYSSEVRAEEEASWVGYGWSLEAPAIYRMRKGLPDDMKERLVLYHDKGTINTSSLTLRGGAEVLSINKSLTFGVGGTFTVSCNSMTGFDAVMGIAPNVGVAISSDLSLGIGVSFDTKGRFGLGMGLSTKSKTGGAGSSLFGTSLFGYDPQSRQSPNAGMQRPFSGRSDISELSFRITPYEAAGTFSTSTITFVDQNRNGSGYLYVPDAMVDFDKQQVMMDYLVEREHNVSRDDPSTLPIPLPANDEFLVSAPGFGGKFRAHHALPLGVRPALQVSTIDNRSLSLKAVAGLSFGVGIGGIVPFPTTYTMTTSGMGTEWNLNGETRDWRNEKRMLPFFRYMDDPADEVRYSSSDGALVPGFDGLSKSSYHPVNRSRLPRMNRSVEYRTAGDLKALHAIANSTLKKDLEGRVWGTGFTIEDMPAEVITDFSVTNEDGTRVDFTTPVYSTSEKSTSYTKLDRALNVLRPATRVFYSTVPYREDDASDVSTREMSHPYAHAWYAGAIYTPDYVDVNDNGPDDADAGGWTAFSYGDRIMRRWRSPYNGYWIDRQDVDDNVDDVLSFATGRQQQVYLSKIETATHIAILYTNKNRPPDSGPVQRLDNYPPAADGTEANVPSPRPLVNNDAQYLSQIVLYKKDGANPPIQLQTVHFSYDYSIAPGNPSSASYGGTHVGKLTLRRIWTEGRDVKESSIAPVDFYYNYPTAGTGAGTTAKDEINVGPLTARYGASVSFPSPVTENPTFNANNIDAWGYQTGIRPADDPGNPVMEMQRFAPPQYWQTAGDPGTYRLKTIKMPTGNRIVPIYERRTYAWVQDKPAMSLVPLTQYAGDISRRNKTGPSTQENAFTVAVQQVGLDPADVAGIDRYVANLKSRFVDNGEPMYFRFAYDRNLCDDATQPLDQFYVRGYGKVMSCSLVTVTGGQKAIRLTIGAMDDSNFGTSSMSTLQAAQYNSPYGVVIKYWKTFLQGKCQCDDGDTHDAMGLMVKFGLLPGWLFSQNDAVPIGSLARIVPIRSVLKLPLAGVKAGGGARVARLLTISPDGTQEAGDASALGTEYIYGDYAGTVEKESWGVATNEPDIMREENAVVGIDPEYWHRAANEILDDALLAKMEGPIGYSLLPGASVGYWKIVMRPLNKQANTAGYSVMKYRTVKDVPTVAATKTSAIVLPNDYLPLSLPMFQKSTMDVGIRQGFAIRVRQYHGLLLSSERFSGVHGSSDPQRLVASTQYDYAPPGEIVDYFNTEAHTLRARTRLDHQDIISESRLFTEKMNMYRGDFTVEAASVAPLVPLSGLGFMYNGIDHSLKTAVVTNVLNQSPVMRRTISMVDGRRDTSEIMAYDIRTGLPAITRRTDSYQGTSATGSVPVGNHNSSITAVTMPALAVYRDVGQRAEPYRQVFKSGNNHPVYGIVTVDALTSALTLTRTVGPVDDGRTDSLMWLFTVGDEIAVYQGSSLLAVVAVSGAPSVSGSITVPVRNKVGTLVATSNVEIVVLRSGRKNFITAQAASTAYYGLDLAPALTRSRTLYGLENNLNAFNNWVRDGSGAGNRTHVNYLRFDNGTNVFDVTAPYRDDIDNACSTTVGVTPLSKFWFATMVKPSGTQVDIGILKPYDANFYESGTCTTYVNRDFMVCSYPWSDRAQCSDNVWARAIQPVPPGVAVPSAPRCFDTHTWDMWRLFRVGDQGTLTINTFSVPPTAPNAGNVRLVGGDLPALTIIPASARVLSAQTLSWQGFDVDISGTRYGAQWLPVTRWTWNAASPLDASGAVSGIPAVTVFESAGTFARPTPATTAMWYDPASVTTIAPTSDGWHRGTLIKNVNMHGQPTLAEDKFAVASIMQHDAPGRVVQATFADAIAGKAWYQSMEDVTSGTTTAAAFTGLKSLAIASGGNATIDRPANAIAGSVSNTADITIRMWIRPQTLASSPPAVTSITVNGTALTASDVLGTIDGWTLIETKRTETNTNTSVSIASSSYALYVDDVIVHSPTAVTSAMVTDVELRPVAVFGDDHYPDAMSYDPRGAAAGLVNYSTNGRAVSLTGGGNVPKQVRTALFLRGGANPDFQFKELP